jgi:hypothetical protein
MANKKVDHVSGKPEKIVKAEKNGNIRGSQLFSQTAFDLSGKAGKLPVFGELFRDVGILIGRLFIGGFREVGGCNQTQLPEGVFSGFEAQTVPAELAGKGLGGKGAVFAEQSEIKESSVAVAVVQEALEGLPGDADAVVWRMDENIGHGEASFLRLMRVRIGILYYFTRKRKEGQEASKKRGKGVLGRGNCQQNG